ncbi:MAG: glycosyltransferase family A protein [Acidobacteriaceae bacterium]
MNDVTPELPLVSALFITYKRFEHLQSSLEAFRRNTSYPNLEIVIADDGSGTEIQNKIRRLPAHRFALAGKNRGLGANNNAGLSLCTGKYVLMIQDDWICHGPSDYLEQAVKVMEANPDVGLINFAGGAHPPDLSMPLAGSRQPCYVTPHAAPNLSGGRPLSLYSDQPHLQSRDCLNLLGPYKELPMVRSESCYEDAWNQQSRFRAAVFPEWHLRVFQCDYSAASYSAMMFSRRTAAALFPTAQWLKKNCHPIYRVSRSCFYLAVRRLEDWGVK